MSGTEITCEGLCENGGYDIVMSGGTKWNVLFDKDRPIEWIKYSVKGMVYEQIYNFW